MPPWVAKDSEKIETLLLNGIICPSPMRIIPCPNAVQEYRMAKGQVCGLPCHFRGTGHHEKCLTRAYSSPEPDDHLLLFSNVQPLGHTICRRPQAECQSTLEARVRARARGVGRRTNRGSQSPTFRMCPLQGTWQTQYDSAWAPFSAANPGDEGKEENCVKDPKKGRSGACGSLRYDRPSSGWICNYQR